MNKSFGKTSPDKIKRYLGIMLILILLSVFSGCNIKKTNPIIVKDETELQNTDEFTMNPTTAPTPTSAVQPATADDVFSFIRKSGTTLETRINPPAGYARVPSEPQELTGFIRGLGLKADGSKVTLYDGTPKAYQDGHAAVFDLEVGSRDLQQCADSVIRIYAEYYWSIGAYDRIAFHLTNGFLMEYTKWRDGYRIIVDGNDVSWSKTKAYDASYKEFRNYLDKVFTYAGTLSLSTECIPVSIEDLRPGDMFLEGGSPGHCVLVVDAAEDQSGNRCYLLAQGFMPAQDFHVLKNPLHSEDPWYYASELTYPFHTPLFTFHEGSLVRWSDFPLNEAGTPLTFQDPSGIEKTSVDRSSIETLSGTAETEAPAESPSSRVTLLAVGDNLIHIQVVQSGKQADGTLNYDHLYSNIKDVISSADIAVINQETIFGGKEFGYSGYPDFNSPTEIGDAVIHTGFDVVLQATNHTLDMGYEGLENTFAYWDKHPEITVLGINETKEESEEIPIIEKNGIKIAMLNYTFSLNGHSIPEDKPYLVNMLDKKKMAEDIKKAKEKADFTIVFPHWGTEYVYEPTKSQEALTEFFYQNGVDLVIGSHPHVLEPVKWIETEEDHRMLVYYSLGNFLSYQKEAPRMLGGMASITISKDASGTYISDASIIPLVTHFENGPADYKYAIYELDDYNSKLADAHGVSELARYGPFTYQGTLDLAEQILGSWYKP